MRGTVAALAFALMGTAVLPPVALVRAAVRALAGDEELELKLLPKAKKGFSEEIAFDVNVSYGTEKEQLTGKLTREIRAVDDEGLPSSETIQLLSSDYRHEQAGSSYGTSGNNTKGAQTVKRSGKARNASASVCELPHVSFKHVKDVTNALQRDPDALARAIEPDEKMKVDDRWEVEPKDLLVHFVGAKAKLIEEGTKAVASLETLHKKDGKVEATIALKATILYTAPDDPDTKCKLVVTASLRGPIDGSAPPRKTKVDLTFKEGDEKKLVQHLSFERTPAEKEADEEEKAEEKPKKTRKKATEEKSEDKE